MFLQDEDIQKNVVDQLKWDPRIRPTEIRLTVNDGCYQLRIAGRLILKIRILDDADRSCCQRDGRP